jgi:hypothetical protein
MHNGAWAALLRHIPAEQHNKLIIVTASGVEIAIQGFLRIEKELVILKGRLAGSQDQGRVFFIPFAQIDYIGSSLAWTDAEFNEAFDSLTFPDPPDGQDYEAEVPSSRQAEYTPAPRSAPVPSNGSNHGLVAPTAGGSRPNIRSEVLERFRNTRGNGPSSSANLPRPPHS